ncbi:ABC transporter permease subunit [Bacillus cereus]
MIFSVLAISFTAYAFSRYRFVGRKNGLLTFLILQMIPNFAALIALYVLAQLTGLIDTHLALILIYVGGAIPMNTWLMKGYFDTIPKELDRVSSYGWSRTFPYFLANHYVPLAKPIVAVVALFTFIGPFTDFILASIILYTLENYNVNS